MTKTRLGLRLQPLDVLFFRDGRPFEAGMRASGGLPRPQTLAGALRSHLWRELGIDFGEMRNALKKSDGDVPAAAESLLGENAWAAGIRTAGPWLWSDGSKKGIPPEGPLVPAPADLLSLKNEEKSLIRAAPRKKSPDGWAPASAGMLPLWHGEQGSIEAANGFLTSQGLETYLAGGTPDSKDLIGEEALYTWEDRTGVGIDADRRRAEDHMLYSVRFLRLREGVSLYAEIEIPSERSDEARSLLNRAILPFGGEGRRVELVVEDEPFAWPSPGGAGDGALALLVTPGIFLGEERWRPDARELPGIVSAAVPGSEAISGWDMARKRPKPTRHAVRAGSVYFFEKDCCQNQGAFVRLCGHEESDALGYGLALKGVWKS
ncbi:MAG: type III-B CRISPR module-associated protein Cmr3 [Polyangia bacterium]